MKIVIMAGGKGTRIASINSEVPKPMIPILDKPILQYQIESLKRQGYLEIILVIGHLGHVIKDYFGDGSGFGITITYVEENEPLGTAGALYLLKDQLTEDFLLINGDIIFDIDIKRFFKYHKEKGGDATLFTHPNSHPYDSGVIFADQNAKITNWLHKEDERLWYKNRVNAGLHMLSPHVLELFTNLKKVDLDREVLKPLIKTGNLFAYDSPEYVKDMGTPDRYYAVTNDIESGKVQAKNLANKQRAIFLDRDGTINVYKGFLTNIDDFELIGGAAEAIKVINDSGYLAIVITNQPVIARGEVSLEELQEIHNKMETLLGEQGAYVDDLFYCPHHPDKGFEGERVEYKIVCQCRKPKPGLFFEAAEKYNIDLSQSYMIGDAENDIKAGKAAGCKTVLLQDSHSLAADITAKNMLEAINKVLPE
ncbi:D-glycero-beta-D-manno-heptose 1,7-bisphosphate 7-phosphatase [Neobacillus niacini]|uniref:D-glycero-beta-D-manno-heptose 1,7-bisphosphate 7-phosphatase n=1 Tax=Neobacillus niacini TaxID=86668 RepID=UPI0021CB4B78|nr:D-glycero-beta-D-manno-heptose 1,7-bisphosphate 7-phosphatase [Neobacillus niacini]MCM3763515.1 D-glycero-beta-D-manno-heptose 1,7-bisphosphate 7-phosphatase [Neobacillus niacini]